LYNEHKCTTIKPQQFFVGIRIWNNVNTIVPNNNNMCVSLSQIRFFPANYYPWKMSTGVTARVNTSLVYCAEIVRNYTCLPTILYIHTYMTHCILRPHFYVIYNTHTHNIHYIVHTTYYTYIYMMLYIYIYIRKYITPIRKSVWSQYCIYLQYTSIHWRLAARV